MPTAATEVGDLRASAQPLGEAVGHRKDDIDQRRVEHLSALLRHQRVEARVLAVGESTASAEASDDLLFDLSQQRDELRDAGEVVRSGRPRQHRRAMARQRIGLRGRVIVDDPPGDDAAQPLANVAFVEACGIGDLGTGGGREFGHRVEQLGLMADGQQDGQARAVDRADDPFGELLGRFPGDRRVLIYCRHS